MEKEIDLSKIDFIVMNHGEVDHSGALPYLMEKIPQTPIYCTANAVKSLVGQYHHPEWNFKVVKTGDSVDIGNNKKLVFVEMRMLHWPDSMATYLTGDNILFSNDAFGQHYGVEELFNDKADQCLLAEEAMKYYANILTPFSVLVKRKIEEIVNSPAHRHHCSQPWSHLAGQSAADCGEICRLVGCLPRGSDHHHL